jgi:hypothetical protein
MILLISAASPVVGLQTWITASSPCFILNGIYNSYVTEYAVVMQWHFSAPLASSGTQLALHTPPHLLHPMWPPFLLVSGKNLFHSLL